MDLKVGDIVQRKTAGAKNNRGPKMTIARILDDTAWCDWYEGPKLVKERFPLSSLEPAES